MVIFDIDGSSTDTNKAEDKCFMKASEKTFGIDITNQKLEPFKNVTDRGITEEIINREFNRNPTKEEYSTMVDNLMNELTAERNRDKSQFTQVTRVNEFFNYLKNDKNLGIRVATGLCEKSELIKLDSTGLNPTNLLFSYRSL